MWKGVYRAVFMMCWACPSTTMWRSVPKSFARWAEGWTVMGAKARWWAFFPPSGACDRLSPGMCWCWCFRGGGPRARDSTPCRGMACSLDVVWQDVYAWVPWHRAQVHVGRYGGGLERLVQGQGACAVAGRVVLLTSGVVDAV